MQYKSFLFLAIVIFLTSITSGMLYIENSTLVIDKFYGQNKILQITLSNIGPQDFTNISFKDNDYIIMTEIPLLHPGQSTTFNATIISDVNYIGEVRLEGYIYREVGVSPKTYNISVDDNDGISECYISIIIGDSINWSNYYSYSFMKMVGSHSLGWPDNVIPKGEDAQYNFIYPEIFSYHFLQGGFGCIPTTGSECIVEVNDDEDYIIDRNLSAILNLDLTVVYPETNIIVNTPIISYTLPLDSNGNLLSTGGMLTIQNTGNEIVRNAYLSGDFFSFNPNSFDIAVNEVVPVSYTILPGVTYTNQTNQTYTRIINISGNFNTFSQDISVFIPYQNIPEGGISGGLTFFEMIKQFCELNPTDEWCIGRTTVITQNVSDLEFNYTMTLGQMNSLFEFMFVEADAREEFENFMKEILSDYDERLNTTSLSVQNIQGNISGVNEGQKSLNNNLAIFFIFLITVIFGVGFYIYIDYIKRTKKYNLAFGKFLKK